MTADVVYLTAEDIGKRLGCSRATAFRIARSCVHVRVGRLLRVPEEAFARYLAARTEAPWDVSTSANRAEHGTGTGPTSAAGRVGSRSARAISKSPGRNSADLSWEQPIRPRIRGTR